MCIAVMNIIITIIIIYSTAGILHPRMVVILSYTVPNCVMIYYVRLVQYDTLHNIYIYIYIYLCLCIEKEMCIHMCVYIYIYIYD